MRRIISVLFETMMAALFIAALFPTFVYAEISSEKTSTPEGHTGYPEKEETNTISGPGIKKTDFELFFGIARKGSTASWALEYELMLRDLLHFGEIAFDAGFGYINEGHPEGSHRDGFLAQAWARKDFGRARISVGAGPYLFNDRHTGVDNNRVGGMFSADVDYRFKAGFSAGLRVNQTAIHESINSTSFFAKAGISSTKETVSDTKNEISVFGSVNSMGKVIAKYSRELSGDFANIKMAAIGVTGERDGEGGGAEICLKNDFGKQSEIDICAGPYYDISAGNVVAIIEISYEYRLRDYPFSLLLNHVRTSNLSSSKKQGLDEFGIGIGYRF